MSETRGEASGPGAMLRAAREKQGLHIAALAAAIKVSPRKLDALEHDRWQELPDATFTRALAQTVCRTLKVDAKPILDQLPAAALPSLEPYDTGLNEPFRERPGRDDPGMGSAAVRPMVWAALALGGAAALVYVFPAELWGTLTALRGAATPELAAPQPAAAPALVLPPATGASTAATLLPLPPEAAVSAVAGETVFSAPEPQASSAAVATPVASAASGLVQLRTSEASWVEARDARGTTLLSRTVLPGESVGLDGKLPIRLTIGNAAATQLGFRGQNVDLAPSTRDNVARVELP